MSVYGLDLGVQALTETGDCRRPGCVRDAKYAGLCEKCARDEIERRRDELAVQAVGLDERRARAAEKRRREEEERMAVEEREEARRTVERDLVALTRRLGRVPKVKDDQALTRRAVASHGSWGDAVVAIGFAAPKRGTPRVADAARIADRLQELLGTEPSPPAEDAPGDAHGQSPDDPAPNATEPLNVAILRAEWLVARSLATVAGLRYAQALSDHAIDPAATLALIEAERDAVR